MELEKKGRVLVIDDNSKNIQLAASILDMHNYNVEFALSGRDGLKMLDGETFDVVLLDVMMPDMDGFETCVKIRNSSKSKNVPVIFITAKDDRESVAKGFNSGGNDYIVKPYDSTEFIVSIQNQIERYRSRKQLEALNFNLESIVKEKTEELVFNNDILNQLNNDLINANNDLKKNEENKRQFLNIIGHEIGGSVQDSVGMLQIIKYKIDSKKVTQLVDKIDDELTKLEQYVKTALRISELQSNFDKLSFERIELNKVLGFTLLKLDNKIRQKQLRIVNHEYVNKHFITGEVILINTFMSLVFEFIFERNSTNSSITYAISENNSTIKLQIFDESDLINDEEKDNLFDFYYSTNSSLYFAKIIADAHKIGIEIDNRNTKGLLYEIVF